MFFTNLTASESDHFHRCLTGMADLFGLEQIYYGDGLITFRRNLTFLHDPDFRQAVENARPQTAERALVWRLHVLAWAAKLALHRPGDFVECGVYEGFCSRVLVEYLDFAPLPRRYFLYDIFNNSGGPGAGIQMPSHGIDLERQVRQRFANFPNVVVVPGYVPDSFTQAVPDQIAFLHIDMNDAGAERGALEALYPRLSPGAPIVFDDYGWQPHAAQTATILDFFRPLGVPVLELPTGQGLVIKP